MFTAEPLPYAFSALEPHFDARTMEIHFEKHYKGYINALNAALKGTSLEKVDSMHTIWGMYNDLSEDIRLKVDKFGGGFTNHYLFWNMLSPETGQSPRGALKNAIERDFGSFDGFVSEFSTKAASHFGSGWAWLVHENDKFTVRTTSNQDFIGKTGTSAPYLGLDLWEHAYYLKYQNRRPEYIKAFFNIINWHWISDMFEQYTSK